jgi:VanZ family protein
MIRKNIFSISVGLLILILSLSSADKFQKIDIITFEGIDKVVHFTMYFVFMSVILIENRNNIKNSFILFLISLIPLSFGALVEVLQSWITSSRSGSVYDLLFNLTGILLSVFIFWRVRIRKKTLSNK